MLADTVSLLYMYLAICEYTEDDPTSVRLYLLNLLFLELTAPFKVLQKKKKSSVKPETRLSYTVFYMFAAKVLHIYFTSGCLKSVTLLVGYLVSYNWNLILI